MKACIELVIELLGTLTRGDVKESLVVFDKLKEIMETYRNAC